MNTLKLSYNDKTAIAELELSMHDMEVNVHILLENIEASYTTNKTYHHMLEPEKDLAILCLEQIATSLADVKRYIGNLKVLAE